MPSEWRSDRICRRKRGSLTAITMLLASLTYALTAIILLLGWRFGGGPERLAVIAIFAWVAVDPLYRSIFATPEFGSTDWALFAFDAGLAGGLTAVALNANRIWPIFASAFSIVPVLGHFAVFLNSNVVRQAYWALVQLPFLFVLLLLLIGVSAHRKRVASGTACQDWSR